MPIQKPDIILTTDIVLFAMYYGELCVITIKRDKEPFAKQRTLPGGFIRYGETSMDCAIRVLKDKCSLQDAYIEQLYTFDSPGRDPRGNMTSITYMATTHIDQLGILNNLNNCQLTPLYALLGFDHNQIVEYALQRLRNKLHYTTIISTLLPAEFTLSELQNYYEILLNTTIDKRNFRKKFTALDLLIDTGNIRKGLKQRPAKLYKFKSTDIEEITLW
jgi:8-oxo-dGTP diphosphatase